jgi:hypothetical protein
MSGMNQEVLQPFTALARAQAAEHQPQTLYRALDTVFAETLGHTLFTILRYDGATNESARVYSNMPQAYPTSAKKALAGGNWADIVLTRGEAYIGRTPDDLRAVFADHALIASLGCESVLNVPVRWKGHTLASLNLLHTRAWYRDDHVPFAQSLAQFALPALLDGV